LNPKPQQVIQSIKILGL